MLKDPAFWIAIVFVLIGLIIHLFVVRKDPLHRNYISVSISWFFFAFAPVLLIFKLFPGLSDVSGTLGAFKVSGPLTGFVLVWWLGTRSTIKNIVEIKNNDLRKLQQEKPPFWSKYPDFSRPTRTAQSFRKLPRLSLSTPGKSFST